MTLDATPDVDAGDGIGSIATSSGPDKGEALITRNRDRNVTADQSTLPSAYEGNGFSRECPDGLRVSIHARRGVKTESVFGANSLFRLSCSKKLGCCKNAAFAYRS